MVLVEAVGVLEVLRLQPCAERTVQRLDHLVEGEGMARSAVVDPAPPRGVQRVEGQSHHILHVDEIPLLLAALEHAGPLAGLHLTVELVDHARSRPLVGLERPVDVEIPEPDDPPGRVAPRLLPGQVVELDLAEGVNIGGRRGWSSVWIPEQIP